jgi:single-strand DNA-binding protein
MNNVQILGTITREVELKYTNSGVAIGSFGIAYNEKRKQQDGSYGDVAHFFDITAFGKTAENINSYFQKGSRILLNGSLDFQSWVDKDGQKRSKVGIKVNSFDFIDKRDNSQQSQPQQSYQSAPQGQPQQRAPHHTDYREQPQQRQMPDKNALPSIDIDEDEIPF